MPFSFRTRLTFSYILVLAVLLAIAAAFLIITLRREAERKLDATLWVLGATEAEGVAARIRDRNLRRPDDLTVNDVDYRDIAGYDQFQVQKYVTVINAAHEVADFSLNLPNNTPLPIKDALVTEALAGEIQYDTSDVKGVGRLRMVYVPITGHETEPFVVVVGIPTEVVGAEVASFAKRIALGVLLVLALAGAGGALLARWALRPVGQTVLAVERITERNLHDRLPEPHTKDEIGLLISVFNQLLARLDRAFDVQRRFTADASHEICTPLTVLQGDTQVALLERRTPEEYETILRSNLEEIERLSRLTSNLLTLARTDAGEQQLVKDFLIFNEVVSEIYTRLRPVAEERGIDMSLNSSECVLIEADRSALRQVVFNLVNNALRYTPRGGRVRLDVGPTPEGAARFAVTDTGIGISAEALPHIFDRFYRAGEARVHEAGGSGLGLAICQATAAAHGGHILVESSYGRGSCFTLLLPAAHSYKVGLHSESTFLPEGFT